MAALQNPMPYGPLKEAAGAGFNALQCLTLDADLEMASARSAKFDGEGLDFNPSNAYSFASTYVQPAMIARHL